MNNNFKHISKNTISHISLHDCECARLHYENAALVFSMEWMEVLSTHPDNPYTKAHQSTEGHVCLIDPAIISCDLVRHDGLCKQVNQAVVEMDIHNFEVLDFTEISNGDGYTLTLFGIFTDNPEFDLIQMEVCYSESIVMFNQLTTVSWFENDNQ